MTARWRVHLEAGGATGLHHTGMHRQKGQRRRWAACVDGDVRCQCGLLKHVGRNIVHYIIWECTGRRASGGGGLHALTGMSDVSEGY
jgi:hypothetical protein